MVRCQWWSISLGRLLTYETSLAVTSSSLNLMDSDFRLFFNAFCSELLIFFCLSMIRGEGWNKTGRKIAKMINLQVIRIIICSFSYLIFSIRPSAPLFLPLSPFHASCLELGFSSFWPALSSRCLLRCSDHWFKEQMSLIFSTQGLAVGISLVRQIVHIESHLWL